MKTIKLKDVQKKGFRLSDSDRLNLNSIETSKNVTGAMQLIAKAMEANIAILGKMGEHMEVRIAAMDKLEKKLPSPPAPKIEVTVPVDKTKKKFRATPVRDEDGNLKYVDVEQI